jgi:lysophospholipase L1-like esterase
MIYNLLLCLGDSLTAGARDPHLRNYPLELGQLLSTDTGEEWFCATEAANGRTSSELARDCYAIMSRYPDVYGVLVLIGTNDSRHRIPPDVFEDNLGQILRVCRILKKRAYVLTIPPVNFQRHFLWYDREACTLIAAYNQRIAALKHAEVIDVAAKIGDDHLVDGVHLTHEGNRLIARVVRDHLLAPAPTS